MNRRSNVNVKVKEFADLVRNQCCGNPIDVLEINDIGQDCYSHLFSFGDASYQVLDENTGLQAFGKTYQKNWRHVLDEACYDAIVACNALTASDYPWVLFEQVAYMLRQDGYALVTGRATGLDEEPGNSGFRFDTVNLDILAKWSGLKIVEAGALASVETGDQEAPSHGYCYCIVTHDNPQFAEATCAPQSIETSRHPPARHRDNPLTRAKFEAYYDLVRKDVVEVVSKTKLKANRVLELGCSSGATAQVLRRLLVADYYAGIELDPDAAAQAEHVLDKVYNVDIETTTLSELGLQQAEFDMIVALDVLEHLFNPWDLLAELTQLLRPKGQAIVSIPNIRNISILQELANGKWTYQGSGILDATHVRFFTHKEIEELLVGAGLEPGFTQRVLGPMPDLSRIGKRGNKIQLDKLQLTDLTDEDVVNLFTYQYVIVASKA